MPLGVPETLSLLHGSQEEAQVQAAAASSQDHIETLHAQEQLISELRDCVRRECEERTHLLIEASELRDRLAAAQAEAEARRGQRTVAVPTAPRALPPTMANPGSIGMGDEGTGRLPGIPNAVPPPDRVDAAADELSSVWLNNASRTKGKNRQKQRGTMAR